jgi:CubicO group peptidase (beta-lactamase class C family)
VHHLLTHTAGLNHWPDHRAEIDLCARIAPAAAIREFQRPPLRFEPGTDWYYSSPGYVLLAHIVEAAGGRPYRSYLQEEIFEPVGLSDTFVGMPAADAVRLAEPYSGGVPTPSFELDSIGMGAGDVWSTTRDLVRWDRTLAAGGFLSDKSRELTFAPHARTSGRLAEYYGYGWQLGTINGHRVHFHSGGNAGFSTYNAWFPDLDAYIVVLTNDDTTDSQELTIKLAQTWL